MKCIDVSLRNLKLRTQHFSEIIFKYMRIISQIFYNNDEFAKPQEIDNKKISNLFRDKKKTKFLLSSAAVSQLFPWGSIDRAFPRKYPSLLDTLETS